MKAEDDAQPDLTATDRDLGFGSIVARDTRRRLLNRDGSFNVRREGQSVSPYHFLLTVTWPQFLGIVVLTYLIANSIFASLYMLAGPGALRGGSGETVPDRFADAFFFSVHTLATIGYGTISPGNRAADVLVTAESITGILAFALVAGLVFARFSRPTPDIVFSSQAVVGPYGEGTGLMFRLANHRNSELVNLEATVLMSRWKEGRAGQEKEFLQLTLERDRVIFFPLTWTIVHPITKESPLFLVDSVMLREMDAEILILLSGTDESFAQTVHSRTSYKWGEVVFGARFKSVFTAADEENLLSVDIRKIDEIEPVGPVETAALAPGEMSAGGSS